MHAKTLLPLCCLSLAASALPALKARAPSGRVALPMNSNTSPAAPKLRARDDSLTTSLGNQFVYYTVNVSVGTPPQNLTLLLDTGSSDIWAYDPSSSSQCSNCTTQYYDPTKSSTAQQQDSIGVFNISYGTPNSGVTGYYVSDTLSLEGTSVTQIMGVATVAHEGDPPGGIFGIGLAQGESIVDFGGTSYPGYVDNLAQAGVISTRAYSVFLNAQNATDPSSGYLIFGAPDDTLYTGDLVPFSLIDPAPDGEYRLDIAEPTMTLTAGSDSLDIPPASSDYVVVMDTGTYISRIPEEQFDVMIQALSLQEIGNGPLYAIDCSFGEQTGGVSLTFSDTNGTITIDVPWTQLVIPDPDLPSGYCDFGFAARPDASAADVFIIGATVLRSTYLYFNYDAATISIAQANYDH